MKNTVTILYILLFATIANAQVPQGIPYQAVARNSSGAILANQAIRVRFSIHDSAATGTTVYRETFMPTTSAQGLFNVNVGTGTAATGAFASINWGNNPKFMQVEMDPAGGTSYVDMGTQQMMSVPYAMYSNNGLPAGNAVGDMLLWNGNSWTKISKGSNGQVLAIVGDSVRWANPTAISSLSLHIGMSYQGGVIAYILQPGDPGYDPTTPHGLIAAFNDQSTNAGFCTTTLAGISTALGTGASNTAIISAGCSTGTAGKLCYDLILGGYSDWYLPSLDELSKLYAHRSLIGGFSDDVPYWSSSATGVGSGGSTGGAYVLNFVSGTPAGGGGWTRVRAVRSF